MADNAVVHIGENSREYVAYKLLQEIAETEGVTFSHKPFNEKKSADRKYILDTYAECLEAVQGHRSLDR